AHGNAAPAAASLSAKLSGLDVQPKGLLATEGVVSIPFQGQHPIAVRSHFYEFEDEQDKSGRIFGAPELKPGRSYRVLITHCGRCEHFSSPTMPLPHSKAG